MATIEQVLSGQTQTGVIQGVKSGVLPVVPDAFLQQSDRSSESNVATWFEVDGSRKLASTVQYGAPAKTLSLSNVKRRTATMLHTYVKQTMPAAKLLGLIDPTTGEFDNKGVQEVARQTKQFKQQLSNTRVTAVQVALLKGEIHYDANGNLLENSTGAATSVDFGVPAGNKGQLDVFGDGDIISGSWASASNSIATMVKNIKKAAIKKTGYPLKYALYGENIASYIAKNDEAQGYLLRNPVANQKFVDTGELPDGLFGLTWIPADTAFYADHNGAIKTILGADEVAFLPEASPDWYELLPGSFAIPKNTGVSGGDMTSALTDIDKVVGMFSYGSLSNDPPSIEQFAGDTFLPLIKVPSAVFFADVTP